MKILYISVFAVLNIFITSCYNANESTIIGSGVIATDTIKISSFEKIATNGQFEIILTQSDQYGLIVEGDENILKLLKTEIKSNTLEIGMKSDNIKINSEASIKVYIQTPTLNRIENKGALQISSTNVLLCAPELHIENKGVLSGSLQVQSNHIVINSAGAGALDLSGSTNKLAIDSKGAGSIGATDLLAKDAVIKLSGAGNITVYATHELDVAISGVGNVSYKGNPEKLKKNIKGLGAIENIQ